MSNSNYSSKIEKQKIRGVVTKVTFNNPETGFSIIEIDAAQSTMPVKLVGEKLPLTTGTELIATGYFREHPKFGHQFKVDYYETVAPSTKEGMKKFLGSGFITGIGEKTAEQIVNHFGISALDVIFKTPEKLKEINGIGSKKTKQIFDSIKEHQSELEVRRYFSEIGISPNLTQKIIAKYKDQALEIVKNNPYQLAYDLKGIGFLKADEIGKNQNIPHNSPDRIKAGLYYTLSQATNDGHSYLTKDDLISRSKVLLNLSSLEDFEQVFTELVNDKMIIDEDSCIYLKYLHSAEKYVANFFKERIQKNIQKKISDEQIRAGIKKSELDFNIQLTEEQKEAVSLSSQSPVSIITGGPGCGKTTVIRSIVNSFLKAKKTIALAAPTGKASQRMSEVSGIPSSTIHRLLRYDPFKGTFYYSFENPLIFESEFDDPKEIDLLIIDESSMIDLELAKSLFSALSSNTNLVLVGDKDQLPSVGPGRVFADLIASELIPTIILKKLFRRAETSYITTAAHQVNKGQMPNLPVPDGKEKKDAYFIQRKNPEDIASLVESLVADQIPNKFGIPAEHISVLTPINRGIIGTAELNKKLQNKLNPSKTNEPKILSGQNEFRINDLVCQRVNNYTIDIDGVFNGDIGKIIDIDLPKKEMIVKLWDNRHINYDQSNIGQLSLSYAISIHRSQGSEIPCVVLCLHESQFTLLDRQLLYTAITRAKKLLIIVGSQKALNIACQRAQSFKRTSNLIKRIKSNI